MDGMIYSCGNCDHVYNSVADYQQHKCWRNVSIKNQNMPNGNILDADIWRRAELTSAQATTAVIHHFNRLSDEEACDFMNELLMIGFELSNADEDCAATSITMRPEASHFVGMFAYIGWNTVVGTMARLHDLQKDADDGEEKQSNSGRP